MQNPLYSLSQIEIMSGGNTEFINQMVDLFIKLTPDLIQQLNFGLLESDGDKIYFAAHKLKLSVDMMGIQSIQTEIRMIEKLAKEKGDFATLNTLILHTNAVLNSVILQLKSRN